MARISLSFFILRFANMFQPVCSRRCFCLFFIIFSLSRLFFTCSSRLSANKWLPFPCETKKRLLELAGYKAAFIDAYGTPDNPVAELPEAVRAGVGKGFPSSAILFGNEARGLEDTMISRCDAAVRIPLYGKAESLNVAMSVSVIAYTYAMARHVALDEDNCTSESIEQ